MNDDKLIEQLTETICAEQTPTPEDDTAKKRTRRSGVLLHLTSLPGKYGIGSFGAEALAFIDRLASGGFTVWQTLPFCMPDRYGSPYSSYSAFSGNPFLIDLDLLAEQGYLTEEELASELQDSPWLCDFERLQETRLPLLKLAAKRAMSNEAVIQAVSKFCDCHPQIAEFCLFMALKAANNDLPWYEWNTEKYDPSEEDAWKFLQYEFCREWEAVKAYAHEKGILLVGDIPIYVAYDSSDVCANAQNGIFDLDAKGHLKNVAGVPPDFFAKDGQFWGNPLYNWEKMREDGFSWWKARLRHLLSQFDGVRIDHFRGLESFWSIPAEAETAMEGRWVKGPGEEFIREIQSVVREVSEDGTERFVIAEDLGVITQEVADLVAFSGFPGMRVFQFAFTGDPLSPHLPHNYPKNCVAYTGTHDNNTLLGYLWELDNDTRSQMLSYCGYDDPDWRFGLDAMIRTVLQSHADLVVLPIQDLLGYGADTRLNTPGTAVGNWRYRVTAEQLNGIDFEKFKYKNRLYGRCE